MKPSEAFAHATIAWGLISFALAWPTAARTIIDPPSDISRNGGAYTLTVTPVVELVLRYPAGQAARCQTTNSSPGADPVLHILEVRPGQPFEIARNDDSDALLNASTNFTVPANGQVRVVMRASHGSARGTTNLTCTGYQTMQGLIVGGAFKRVENYRDREKLMTVPLATGPLAMRAYVIAPSGKLVQRFVSGPESAVLINSTTMPTGSFQVVMGSSAGTISLRPQATGGAGRFPAIRDVRDARPAARADRAPPAAIDDRALRPDVAAPATEFEQSPRPPDPPGDIRLVRNDNFLAGHDPDVDGLGKELEANIGTCSARSGVVGNWDCSRAIDPRDTDGDGLLDRDELIGILNKAPFLLLPRWGADPRHKDLFLEVDFRLNTPADPPRRMPRETAMEMARIIGDPIQSPLFRLAHAQALNNPDLLPGVRLHIDNGVRPPPGAPVEELTTYGDWGGYTTVKAVCTDPVFGIARRAVTGEASTQACRPATVTEVFDTSMAPTRRGVFHYALGYPGSGGQAPYHTYRLNMPIDSASSALHELSHNIGLGHGGPDGIGYDANCKPNYPSLMSYSYAYQEDSFSDGFGRSALNNTKLVELGAVAQPGSGPGRAYIAHLQRIYAYNVNPATGDVDWDRDGAISPVPVRAYANNDHSSCEFTRTNHMRTAGTSDRSPALTRLAGRMFVIYIGENDRKLHAETTDHPLTSCPVQEQGGCGPALVPRAINEPWNAAIEAMDAQAIGGGKVLLVYRTAAGLFETTMTRELTFTPPVPIAVTSLAIGDVALANNGATAWLAYRDNVGAAWLKQRAPNGVWAADERIVDAGGAPIGPIAPGSAPGLLYTTRGGPTLYGVFPLGSQGGLSLRTRDATTGRWTPVTWAMSPSMSIGKPAMAMEPVAAGSPLPGRMRLLYTQRQPDNNHIVRIKTLQANGLGPGATLEMEDEMHDNKWYYARGVDLLFEPGIDTNLRAAVTSRVMSDPPRPHFVDLRPRADGVVDFTYRNWNDWETIGIGLCRNRKAGGAFVNCFEWPFKPPPQSPTPQPQPPAPTHTPAECRALCQDAVDSCRSAGNLASRCVQLGAKCRAQCAP